MCACVRACPWVCVCVHVVGCVCVVCAYMAVCGCTGPCESVVCAYGRVRGVCVCAHMACVRVVCACVCTWPCVCVCVCVCRQWFTRGRCSDLDQWFLGLNEAHEGLKSSVSSEMCSCEHE